MKYIPTVVMVAGQPVGIQGETGTDREPFQNCVFLPKMSLPEDGESGGAAPMEAPAVPELPAREGKKEAAGASATREGSGAPQELPSASLDVIDTLVSSHIPAEAETSTKDEKAESVSLLMGDTMALQPFKMPQTGPSTKNELDSKEQMGDEVKKETKDVKQPFPTIVTDFGPLKTENLNVLSQKEEEKKRDPDENCEPEEMMKSTKLETGSHLDEEFIEKGEEKEKEMMQSTETEEDLKGKEEIKRDPEGNPEAKGMMKPTRTEPSSRLNEKSTEKGGGTIKSTKTENLKGKEEFTRDPADNHEPKETKKMTRTTKTVSNLNQSPKRKQENRREADETHEPKETLKSTKSETISISNEESAENKRETHELKEAIKSTETKIVSDLKDDSDNPSKKSLGKKRKAPEIEDEPSKKKKDDVKESFDDAAQKPDQTPALKLLEALVGTKDNQSEDKNQSENEDLKALKEALPQLKRKKSAQDLIKEISEGPRKAQKTSLELPTVDGVKNALQLTATSSVSSSGSSSSERQPQMSQGASRDSDMSVLKALVDPEKSGESSPRPGLMNKDSPRPAISLPPLQMKRAASIDTLETLLQAASTKSPKAAVEEAGLAATSSLSSSSSSSSSFSSAVAGKVETNEASSPSSKQPDEAQMSRALPKKMKSARSALSEEHIGGENFSPKNSPFEERNALMPSDVDEGRMLKDIDDEADLEVQENEGDKELLQIWDIEKLRDSVLSDPSISFQVKAWFNPKRMWRFRLIEERIKEMEKLRMDGKEKESDDEKEGLLEPLGVSRGDRAAYYAVTGRFKNLQVLLRKTRGPRSRLKRARTLFEFCGAQNHLMHVVLPTIRAGKGVTPEILMDPDQNEALKGNNNANLEQARNTPLSEFQEVRESLDVSEIKTMSDCDATIRDIDSRILENEDLFRQVQQVMKMPSIGDENKAVLESELSRRESFLKQLRVIKRQVQDRMQVLTNE